MWINGPFDGNSRNRDWSFGFAVRYYYEDYDVTYYWSVHFLFWEVLFEAKRPKK